MTLTEPPEFKVWTAGSYYNHEAVELERGIQSDVYSGRNFVRFMYAVKSPAQMLGYTRTPAVEGHSYLVSDRQPVAERRQNAISYIAARMKTERVSRSTLGLEHRPIFVPVPSTQVVEEQPLPEVWPAHDLIMEIVGGARLHAVIRFADPPPQRASKGGPRNWSLLKRCLCPSDTLPDTARSAVIVDDVISTGGHMQAVAMVLMEAGIEEVGGICVGATVSEPVYDPWESQLFTLPAEGRRHF